MRHYYYTDKLLLCLAITNLWMLIPTAWGTWWNLAFIHAIQGNTNLMLVNILLSTAQWLLVLGFTTFAFFKRWRWMVIFYVPYLSRTITITFAILSEAWKQNDGWNFLDSRVYSYTYVFLWLLSLLALIVMLIETDYKNLFNRWRGRFVGSSFE